MNCAACHNETSKTFPSIYGDICWQCKNVKAAPIALTAGLLLVVCLIAAIILLALIG